MKQFIAFTKKEFMESIRTGKFVLLLIIFSLFGIMSPVIAKVTPALYDLLADSMQEQGIVITSVEITAMTSWEQFFKNITMFLIILVVMFSGMLVNEFQKGTLINMLTKGLSRNTVLASKAITAFTLWTVSYWLSFGITYGYNAYFWDNSIAAHLFLGGFCIYLLGIWLISLILLFSVLLSNNLGVLLGTLVVVGCSYLLSMVPTIEKYLPTKLLSSGSLLKEALLPGDLVPSIAICCGLIVVNYVISCICFTKKRV